MRVKIYWIEGITSGRLGITARPRGGDWLEDEITSLRQSEADVVVSLLEREEAAELGIEGEAGLLRDARARLHFLPHSRQGRPFF